MKLSTFTLTASAALLLLTGCWDNAPEKNTMPPKPMEKTETISHEMDHKGEEMMGKAPVAAAVCPIAVVPNPGRVPAGMGGRIRFAANTAPGCTITFQGPPTVVPAGAFAPNCIAAGAGANIAVPCAGLPAPVAPPAPPAAAMGMFFSCSCPPAMGMGPNNLNATYLF